MDRNAEDWLNAGSLSVALRKESVDRNALNEYEVERLEQSLSARRAWIEIHTNTDEIGDNISRSPQGERG